MHELSIAEAIFDLARRHVPSGAVLRAVQLNAGPLRCIDPQCLELAWQGIGQGAVAMKLNLLPWLLQCADCGHQWQQPDLPQNCPCGSERIRPIGGDELQLLSIEVDNPPAPG